MTSIRRPGIGRLIGGACFGVLAGLRALDGAWAWAVAFALLAGAQLWLARKETSGHPRAAQSPLTPERQARSLRTWRTVVVCSCLIAIGLLFFEPALGLIAAVAAVVSLAGMHQVRGRPVARPSVNDDTTKVRVE